jgi:LPXTG-motif cell wall-anchored protein
MVFTVETVTDRQGQVVRRGTCGAVSESAIVLPPPEPPTPKITTNAPQHANTGDKISDEATLTGPYPKGTQVEFWYQHTDYTNPGAARDELKCDAPDPDKTEGAVKIGVTVLDHDIAEGVTEKLYSPEFTSDKEGCTWIKETAYTTKDKDKTVLAEGRFGAANERTMWHQPPRPSPPGELPNTGTNVAWPAAIGGLGLLVGAALIGVATWRRRQVN